jgi:hypothetical protein
MFFLNLVIKKEMVKKYYIVGYGTLLYAESLQKTIGESVREKKYIPVIIKGFKRLFNVLPIHYKPSYKITDLPYEKAAANVILSKTDILNGLAFEVSEKEINDLDKRERSYQRCESKMFDFNTGEFMGNGFIYSAAMDSERVTKDTRFLPDWEDISFARTGAYRYGQSFGETYDKTTFLVDGVTRVIDYYKDYLDELNLVK